MRREIHTVFFTKELPENFPAKRRMTCAVLIVKKGSHIKK